jgi:hypothetical protein
MLDERHAAHMDCKFLKSPMAGEISPPRFKLDRLLHRTHNGKILKPNLQNNAKGRNKIKGVKESDHLSRAYRETTERLTLSQNTPRQEQKSSLCTSSQSRSTFTTLLNDSLIDINAFPASRQYLI